MNFQDLGICDAILPILEQKGYQTPSPIQEKTIPPLLEGKDVLGQAQTGTGKTAAFALPILTNLDTGARKAPQVLILAPTRELAIQVAETIEGYAKNMPNVKVLPIYGGADYGPQLRGLKRIPQIIVGTPGRVMDHIRRKSLDLSEITNLVLDEADEMLKMGFIDDVEWILEHTPEEKQVALFSATMPPQIIKIVDNYLTDPVKIAIKSKTTTAATITQKFVVTDRSLSKEEAISRILEVEATDGVIVFVRTKAQTLEVSDLLAANGFRALALNGDIAQKQREHIVNDLKKGKIDILVATDVVARGLDVERVSHVINFDLPFDVESYTHRIGRTGRAGREGTAISLITKRERGVLSRFERVTKQKLEEYDVPSVNKVNKSKIYKFKQKLISIVENNQLDEYEAMINKMTEESDLSLNKIAAAIMHLSQKGSNFFYVEKPVKAFEKREREGRDRGERRDRDRSERRDRDRDSRGRDRDRGERGDRNDRREKRFDREDRFDRNKKSPKTLKRDLPEMELYRVEVGRKHGVRPSNIVGAIMNEAGLEGGMIGNIKIEDNFSMVELPTGMPKNISKHLHKVWVSGQQLKIKKVD